MNQHPLYIDHHYAHQQALARRPVIDTLIFSLAVGISVADTSGKAIANLGFESVKFETPAVCRAILCMPNPRCSKSASRPASRIAAS